jgi:hypothetical protein
VQKHEGLVESTSKTSIMIPIMLKDYSNAQKLLSSYLTLKWQSKPRETIERSVPVPT